MNLKERLLHLSHVSGIDRMMGRTTLIAKAAKELGGMVIAHTHEDAKRIERTHGVTARSMDLNLFGFSGPMFFDHHAVERLFVRAANRIHDLEQEIDKREEQRVRDAESMAKLADEIGRLQKLNANMEAAAMVLHNRLKAIKQEDTGK